MTGILDFGEYLYLDADDFQSVVYLGSEETPQTSSENLSLMRYSGDLSVHLVSTV